MIAKAREASGRRSGRRSREPVDIRLTVAFRFGDEPGERVTVMDDRHIPFVGSLFDQSGDIRRQLAAAGLQVIAIGHPSDGERLPAWREALGDVADRIDVELGDLADAASAQAAMQAAIARLGGVDVLVNAAGITRDARFAKMSLEQWRTVLASNLDSVFHCCKAVFEAMCAQQYGRIVNIASVNGQKGQFGQANYSAAKAGMQGFTKTLAIELGRFGVTANAIAPGFIETEMTAETAERIGISFEDLKAQASAAVPVARTGTPADIAHAVSFFASEGAGFTTGQVLYVAGGPCD